MKKHHFTSRIKKHIAKDRLDKAMATMQEYDKIYNLDNEIKNQIFLLHNQYESLKKQETLGLGISNVDKNKFVKRLLDFILSLEKEFDIDQVSQSPFEPLNSKYIIIGSGITVAVAILFGFSIGMCVTIIATVFILIYCFDSDIE